MLMVRLRAHVKLGLAFGKALLVERINQKNNAIHIGIILSPQTPSYENFNFEPDTRREVKRTLISKWMDKYRFYAHRGRMSGI